MEYGREYRLIFVLCGRMEQIQGKQYVALLGSYYILVIVIGKQWVGYTP